MTMCSMRNIYGDKESVGSEKEILYPERHEQSKPGALRAMVVHGAACCWASYIRFAAMPLSTVPIWLFSWKYIAMSIRIWCESGMHALVSNP